MCEACIKYVRNRDIHAPGSSEYASRLRRNILEGSIHSGLAFRMLLSSPNNVFVCSRLFAILFQSLLRCALALGASSESNKEQFE